MNIFFLDEDPKLAARQMCDKHVVKMVIETAQLLCTAYHKEDDRSFKNLYKMTHVNHPQSIWTRKSIMNYRWVVEHFIALCDEYTIRYGRVHATDVKFRKFFTSNSPSLIQVYQMTEKMNTTTDEIRSKHLGIVESYKQYYAKSKAHIAKWNHSEKPAWFDEYVELYA